ncbi:Trypsin-1 [Folsomia candida]|uniref:Trypsin-1 n=1 Tax=Folsomia candida TaxID=158441 RepID=A0A226F3P1_FOLCA|nr:Trypsin-1 [Folsomia candida]
MTLPSAPCVLALVLTTVLANKGKITGGSDARLREFPYSVSLRTYDFEGLGHFCGGAIVSPSLVITAGACTDPASPKIDEIVAGTLNRVIAYPGQQVRKPRTIVPHPGYTFPPYNDISLIFLDEPFVFHENISAVALPEVNQTTYPNPVVVNGWGAEQYGLPMSEVLQRVTLDTYSDEYCAEFMNAEVPPSLLCAGTNEGGIGACIGDAGAPVTATTDKVYLAGMINSNLKLQGCGFPGPMNHNPEVVHYLEWILQQNRIHNGGL